MRTHTLILLWWGGALVCWRVLLTAYCVSALNHILANTHTFVCSRECKHMYARVDNVPGELSFNIHNQTQICKHVQHKVGAMFEQAANLKTTAARGPRPKFRFLSVCVCVGMANVCIKYVFQLCPPYSLPRG